LENFDEYRQAESIEFLRTLHDRHLFATEDPDRPDAAADEPESLAARRQRVRAMSAADKEELQRAEERFADLDAAERQRLWKLQDDLQQAADGAQLRSVMRRYHEWLKTLSAYGRAELAELEPAGRIAWIQRRLEEERTHRAARPPSSKDMDKLLQWMKEYAASHESQLLAALSEAERKELGGSQPMRARRAFWQAWQHWQAAEPGQLPAMVSDKDLASLRARLSPEVRERLEAIPPDRQWQLVIRWLAQSMQHPVALRGLHGPLTGADDKRLADFFEKDLTDQQRDWLLGLPGEEMQQQLQRLFFQRQFFGRNRPPGRPGFRPDDARRGHPPGTRPPPDRPPRNEPPPEKAQPEKNQSEKAQPKQPAADKAPPAHA
jgi:hypothetical protein